ncbi:hypothetical protein BT63DRAFT_457159 [Microthyrium microscopicum]|uniref:Uncharacterized protein n=1 Tax=Microthyrium microscopicum TaxID=703497 RepID=A0A6A6U7D3_9PEZI|nr:hypothetical protein BT63DRAFT_457159 [Microthyrium microscopicum]
MKPEVIWGIVAASLTCTSALLGICYYMGFLVGIMPWRRREKKVEESIELGIGPNGKTEFAESDAQSIAEPKDETATPYSTTTAATETV